mmetsp:Transcript_20133/g.60267  ORF Transcript_20133/g.60267 Transcript_20133/m.60267 type:complete len:229 (+) Transcript_20133:2498-3184(+)
MPWMAPASRGAPRPLPQRKRPPPADALRRHATTTIRTTAARRQVPAVPRVAATSAPMAVPMAAPIATRTLATTQMTAKVRPRAARAAATTMATRGSMRCLSPSRASPLGCLLLPNGSAWAKRAARARWSSTSATPTKCVRSASFRAFRRRSRRPKNVRRLGLCSTTSECERRMASRRLRRPWLQAMESRSRQIHSPEPIAPRNCSRRCRSKSRTSTSRLPTSSGKSMI